jgi:hypothetical protein
VSQAHRSTCRAIAPCWWRSCDAPGLLDAMSLRLAPLTIYAARNMAAIHADRHPSR